MYYLHKTFRGLTITGLTLFLIGTSFRKFQGRNRPKLYLGKSLKCICDNLRFSYITLILQLLYTLDSTVEL